MTKIAITADLHYGTHMGGDELENYVDDLNKKGVDVLIIGGDLASAGADSGDFIEAVSVLSSFGGKVLFVPGNHDLWTKSGNSFELLNRKIPAILKKYGIHSLQGNPFQVGNLGIVGSVGWYDYSFRKVPENFKKKFEDYYFMFSKDRIVRWEQIETRDYKIRQCAVSLDKKHWQKSIWQDKRYVRWKFTDEKFLTYCIENLKKDILEVYREAAEIMVITHHLPFVEFVPDIPDPVWSFHRAFLGSSEMGKLLMDFPKVRYAFFGHSHREKFLELNGILARNVYFHSRQKTFILNI